MEGETEERATTPENARETQDTGTTETPCPNCGASVREGELKCRNCGSPVQGLG